MAENQPNTADQVVVDRGVQRSDLLLPNLTAGNSQIDFRASSAFSEAVLDRPTSLKTQ